MSNNTESINLPLSIDPKKKNIFSLDEIVQCIPDVGLELESIKNTCIQDKQELFEDTWTLNPNLLPKGGFQFLDLSKLGIDSAADKAAADKAAAGKFDLSNVNVEKNSTLENKSATVNVQTKLNVRDSNGNIKASFSQGVQVITTGNTKTINNMTFVELGGKNQGYYVAKKYLKFDENLIPAQKQSDISVEKLQTEPQMLDATNVPVVDDVNDLFTPGNPAAVINKQPGINQAGTETNAPTITPLVSSLETMYNSHSEISLGEVQGEHGVYEVSIQRLRNNQIKISIDGVGEKVVPLNTLVDKIIKKDNHTDSFSFIKTNFDAQIQEIMKTENSLIDTAIGKLQNKNNGAEKIGSFKNPEGEIVDVLLKKKDGQTYTIVDSPLWDGVSELDTKVFIEGNIDSVNILDKKDHAIKKYNEAYKQANPKK